MLVALVDGFSPAPLRAALGGRRQTACGRAPPVMMATKKPKKAPSTAKGFAAMPKSIGKYELTTDADVAAFMQWLRDGGAVQTTCAVSRAFSKVLSIVPVCVHTQAIAFFFRYQGPSRHDSDTGDRGRRHNYFAAPGPRHKFGRRIRLSRVCRGRARAQAERKNGQEYPLIVPSYNTLVVPI